MRGRSHEQAPRGHAVCLRSIEQISANWWLSHRCHERVVAGQRLQAVQALISDQRCGVSSMLLQLSAICAPASKGRGLQAEWMRKSMLEGATRPDSLMMMQQPQCCYTAALGILAKQFRAGSVNQKIRRWMVTTSMMPARGCCCGTSTSSTPPTRLAPWSLWCPRPMLTTSSQSMSPSLPLGPCARCSTAGPSCGADCAQSNLPGMLFFSLLHHGSIQLPAFCEPARVVAGHAALAQVPTCIDVSKYGAWGHEPACMHLAHIGSSLAQSSAPHDLCCLLALRNLKPAEVSWGCRQQCHR